MKEIFLKTEDNVQIRATHYPGKGDGIILLHMLGRNRRDWTDFATKLNNLDYNVIAIDFRGHGESQLDYSKFSRKDFNNMRLDVKTARNFLNAKRLIIIGASIGANIALNYALDDKSVDAIVLLSPGENYRGVDTFEAVRQYNRAVLIVASEDDGQSISASKKLYNIAKSDKEIKLYKDAGHGTNMFSQLDLADFIIDWMDKYK